MGIFRTQFEKNNLLTHVTVEEIEKDKFGCILSDEDSFGIGDLPVADLVYDIVIKHSSSGSWETVGEPNIKLDGDDLQRLGNAIVGDKTVDLFGPEMY